MASLSVTVTPAFPAGSWSHRLAAHLNRGAFFILLVVTAFAPLAAGGVLPWSLLGIRLLVSASLLLWLLSAALCGKLVLPRAVLLTLLGGYLTVVAVSTALSSYRYGSAQQALNIAVYAAGFLLACALIRTSRRQQMFLVVLFATAAVMGGYGVLQFLGYGLTPTYTSARLSSLYYNSNHYSGYLALMVPLFAGLLLYTKHVVPAALYVLVLLLLIFNLSLTFSWGLLAVAAVLSSLLVVWAVESRKVQLLLGAALLAGFVGIGGLGTLVTLAPELKPGRLEARATEFFTEYVSHSFWVRVAIGQATLKIVEEHPVTGVGPGNFIYAFPKHRPPEIIKATDQTLHKFINYAHNDYTQVASETGLLGLAAFLSFWLLVLFSAPRAPQGLKYGLIAAIASLMLHGLSDGNMTVIPANALLVFLFAGVLHAPAEQRNGRATDPALADR